RAFMEMALAAEHESNPFSARALVQKHGDRYLLVHPPAQPLTTEEMDRLYELPFTRQAHPSYDESIPALEPVENSITVVRGCFGGCAFCSLGQHQGKFIQSRSEASVIREVKRLARSPRFRGTITDLGGQTANMYCLGCLKPEAGRHCRRPSCLYPAVCANLNCDHTAQIRLLRAVRELPEVKHVFIGSGVRHDLALLDLNYVEELVAHHVSGHLKVAPEHVAPQVLRLMRKPSFEEYEKFQRRFKAISQRAGKEQYLLPYFIAGHPGSDREAVAQLRRELGQRGLRVEQSQEFIPLPMILSAAIYHTGLDPETFEPIYVPRSSSRRRSEKKAISGKKR
ncbi:MAG: radical SAM protein, partial [Candidatus Sumerlaeota bacterium]|nr:radical SAM protein [Candidatus Sumerlaeota bacterium]